MVEQRPRRRQVAIQVTEEEGQQIDAEISHAAAEQHLTLSAADVVGSMFRAEVARRREAGLLAPLPVAVPPTPKTARKRGT